MNSEDIGVLLGLDAGERRIGIAVSDLSGRLARPEKVLVRRSRAEDFAQIAHIASELNAQAIVIGLPLNMDGSRGPQAKRIERFAHRLAEAVSLPIHFQDERLSTEIAAERLRDAGKRINGPLDAYAAAVILQEYLDALRPVAASLDPSEEGEL